MSLRGTKRASGTRGEDNSSSKRRRIDHEDALWQLRPVSDLKMSSIYNRSASEAPAELFRKDLISAMKLPDNEPLTSSEYWVVADQWKQDWERGVQVPVNPDSLPAPKVKKIKIRRRSNFQEFKLPKDKYIHLTRDIHYQSEKHHLSTTPARAEAACSYDLDTTDAAWLKLFNAERARAGVMPVTADQFEKVFEELEIQTWDKIQSIMKSEEGLGIEYDENVICDVCRSPDSEDGNEMVFCDSCNICVHQACYGITVIPDGQWLCRPCGDGVRPTCVLCPNQGGAMKCTPTGHKWAHVSCVLWIPEVSIGCAEKMEPITKISSIPASRWSLLCVLCRERKGACIQCSVKTCKTAYHVTCAFKYGLEMRAIIEDENADDGVKLRSYCQKHSVNSKKEKCPGSGSDEEEVKRKRRKDMTSEEKTQARAARLKEIEKEFEKHVTIKDISTNLDIDQDAIQYIYNYWKVKRRAAKNRPLLPPKSDDTELLTHRQEQADLDKMKMFVQLRQDLERVRNLCYMVSRREKLSRSFFRMREQTFHKQIGVLTSGVTISDSDLSAIIEANHGPSIYDRVYSHPNAINHNNSFEVLLARIAPTECGDEPKKDRNGLVKKSKSANPYKKHYVNGSRRSGGIYSGLSSEESESEVGRPHRFRGRAIGSSTDDDAKKSNPPPKKKVSFKLDIKRSPKKTERKKKKVPSSKAVIESSSDDELIKKERSCSKTLQKMENEMTAGKVEQSGTDSDELMPIRSTRNNKFPIDIYTDSSEDEHTIRMDIKADKVKVEKVRIDKIKTEKSPIGNDSQQPLPRTKAAMKEFIPTQPEKRVTFEMDKLAPKKRGRKPNKDKLHVRFQCDYEAKNKENIKHCKKKENATDLIVPQRQAAKKAFENIRSTTIIKKEEISSFERQLYTEDIKPKLRLKEREIKYQCNKVNRKKSKDLGKDMLSYVPQRQAAKKAAAHIKSGLGTKPASEAEIDKKKDHERPECSKISPKKEDDTKSSEIHTSSSSSNSSSSSYSSSSSSENEQEKPTIKPTAKAREIKPIIRKQSMFSPPGARRTVDLPFLDKVSRPLSSTSASSDSDSSKDSDGSGSDSPCPKRPRRRRKGKSISFNLPPHNTPEKKLKTSERGSGCRISTFIIERKESSRTNNACNATRTRTRSIIASRNMFDKSDAKHRKSSKDDTSAPSSNKTPKESRQPSELHAKERQTHEEIKIEIKEELPLPDTVIDNDVKDIINKHNVSPERKDVNTLDIYKISKSSPENNMDSDKPLLKLSVRETSKRDTISKPEDMLPPVSKMRRLSIQSVVNTSDTERRNISPTKKTFLIDKPKQQEMIDKKSPVNICKNFNDNKDWLPKAPSPTEQLAPVEKPGGNEKYMTDDKSLDFDATEKSSVKMIAKIQANLNENTMIKSPKTPMDARTMDAIDIEKPLLRNMRKRSILDPDRKYIHQDASHLQAVEISKSAKIPSAVNTYPSRSMFSPQPKENELFEYEMVAIDDGFNHDEIMKPFASYPEIFFKEDTKEQGVRETLNLVDRLRMQLSSKKVCSNNTIHMELSIETIDKIERNNIKCANTRSDKNSQKLEKQSFPVVAQKNASVPLNLHDNRALVNELPHLNHTDLPNPREVLTGDIKIQHKEYEPIPMTSHEKWVTVPPPIHVVHNEIHVINDRNYEHMNSYNEEIKESQTSQSDAQSMSEVTDTISLSKQSDDSQPISVVDHELDHQNYDNNNSLIHSDCATISSPYITQDPQKWGESKIASRRSSTSSTVSNTSSSSSLEYRQLCAARQLPLIPNIDSYPPIPAYTCAVEPSMPLNQYSTYPDTSPFVGSMLFTGTTAQLSMPSHGPALYPPGLAYANIPLLPPKPTFSLCAAFTSSSQNMAITAAMIASPLPKGIESPRDEMDVTDSDKFSIHIVSSPSISTDSFDTANRCTNHIPYETNDTSVSFHNHDSKSPKSTKFLSKFSVKSPGKSSALLSPRHCDAPKNNKRPLNKRNMRGRGRSKSRGQSVHGFYPLDYIGNSIQSKLVGTVYDFEEEFANDGVNLKSLRDRRKSFDLCKSVDERKSELLYKEKSQSPYSLSPQQYTKTTEFVDNIETELTTYNQHERLHSPSDRNSSEQASEFVQMHTMLPGPVDMRTYQTLDDLPPVVEDDNRLLNFEPAGTEQSSTYIDEEIEKQLQSDLKSGMAATPLTTQAPEHKEPPKEIVIPQMPKVSLSDSRNQLKVKIKGPFLDANYSANNSQPIAAPPSVPIHTNINSVNVTSNACNTNSVPGSTSLRRMRKKELLRQYWTQSMSIDESANNSAIVAPTPIAPSPISRTVITIPKAVASMTSIPTREDYKNVERPDEKKKRKVANAMSRELRHLKNMKDDNDPSDDIKLSSYAVRSNKTHKKRGRGSKKCNKTHAPVTPKLKIKIGTNEIEQVSEESISLQFRPPKKRLIFPSLADIRRENMKFRRKVMADFEETEKTKEYKLSKSEKKKRKKEKRIDKLHIVNSDITNTTKLIIKIKRKKVRYDDSSASSSAVIISDPDPFEYDPSAPDPLAIDTPSYAETKSAIRKVRISKVTPIRLKLARSSQGSGYVMKESLEDDVSTSEMPVSSSSHSLKISKHCEVR